MSYLLAYLRSDIFIPTLLLTVYIAFLIIAKGSIPTAEELIQTFSLLYLRYGYEIILVAAFLESLVLVNFFVPGQIAMAMGVIFARTGQTELTLVVFTACIGAISGYILDYLLGQYGFGDILKKIGYTSLINKASSQLKKTEDKGLILGFAHTNIAAFMSLAAGTVGMSFPRFLLIAIISTAFWSAIWAVIIYALGEVFLTILTKYTLLVILIIIGALVLSKYWKGDTEVNR